MQFSVEAGYHLCLNNYVLVTAPDHIQFKNQTLLKFKLWYYVGLKPNGIYV